MFTRLALRAGLVEIIAVRLAVVLLIGGGIVVHLSPPQIQVSRTVVAAPAADTGHPAAGATLSGLATGRQQPA